MSDSDEMGGYGPTTPAVSKTQRPPNRSSVAGPSKPSSATAAPAKKPTTKSAGQTARKHANTTRPKPQPARAANGTDVATTKRSAAQPRSETPVSDEDGDIVALDAAAVTPSSFPTRSTKNSKPRHENGAKTAQAPAASSKKNGKQKAAVPIVAVEDEKEGDESMGGLGNMDVDESTEQRPKPGPTRVASKPPASTTRGSRQPSIAGTARLESNPANDTQALQKEIDSLRKKNRDLEAKLKTAVKQRDNHERQMNEVLALRQTEPEKLLKDYHKVHKTITSTQRETIETQQGEIARFEPNARTGIPSVLHFMTKDAAEELRRTEALKHDKTIAEAREQLNGEHAEELRVMSMRHEENIVAWTSAVRERDNKLEEIQRSLDGIFEERDALEARVHEQDREMATLKMDHAAEVQQNKLLTSRHREVSQTPAVMGRAVQIAEGSHNKAAYRLYEDLTNLLIKSHKTLPSQFPQFPDIPPDDIFTCVYTYVAVDDINHILAKSLQFKMTLHYELKELDSRVPVTSKDQIEPKLSYSPMGLDMESDGFLEIIYPYNTPFSVTRAQMPLILASLFERLQKADRAEHGGTADEDVTETRQLVLDEGDKSISMRVDDEDQDLYG